MPSDFPNSEQSGQKPKDEDLSAEIARTVSKKPREQVTCRRVSDEHYRCNWWTLHDTDSYDNPQMHGLMVTTSRICQSQFLHVTRGSGGLQIRVVSPGTPTSR